MSVEESSIIKQFAFPLPDAFETTRIKLIPFIPEIHAEPIFNGLQSSPALLDYFPVSFPTLQTFRSDFVTLFNAPTETLFSIIDKTRLSTKGSDEAQGSDVIKKSLAGIIGIVHASQANLSAEIGGIIILPDFQRTFVASNAVGVLLQYCLEPSTRGGLGLRRVVWTTHPDNVGSIKLAKRMGFREEGILRWTWVLPEGKKGLQAGEGRGDAVGRHSAMMAVCWDDWEEGVRDRVQLQIERL